MADDDVQDAAKAPDVTLSASSGGRSSETALEVAADAGFELVVTTDAGVLEETSLFLVTGATESPAGSATGSGASVRIAKGVAHAGGVFVARGTVALGGAATAFETEHVTVTRASAPAPTPSSEGEDDEEDSGTVTEVAAGGEYDEAFARRTLARVLAIAWFLIGIGVLVSLTAISGHIVAMATGVAQPDWSDTIRVIGQVLCIAVGLTGILLGTWLAMLETRGRQRTPAAPADLSSRGTGITPIIEATGALADKLRRVRGLVAVLVVSLLLVLVGIVWNAAESFLPSPASSPSPTSSTLR